MYFLYAILPFLIIGCVVLLVFFIMGIIVFKQTMARHKPLEKATLKEVFKDNADVVNEFYSYHPKDFMFKTSNKYKLICTQIKACENNDKVVVISHGIYCNRFLHVEYALEYLKLGYDVFMYNQRSIGESGGHCNTYGYYERFDMESIVNLLKEQQGYKKIVVHGFSMGASIAAMHSEINEEKKYVNCYILDSPYASLREEFEYVASRGTLENPKQRKLPFHFMMTLGNIVTKMFLRFGYSDVKPKESVKKTTVPMFIIHGKCDPTCLVAMGEEVFDCKVNGVRKIWTPEKSEHIASFHDYPEEYYRRVKEFLQESL